MANFSSPVPALGILFSDLDGTLIHYYEGDGDVQPGADLAVGLPASKTGRRGFISHQTQQKIAAIRAAGTKVVLVSGVRESTFVDRMPYLPFTDAYVLENGGRTFYPNSQALASGSTTAPSFESLEEDMIWREELAEACGIATGDAPISLRTGPIYELCRELLEAGFSVDTHTYYTMLRINVGASGEGSATRMKEKLKGLPSSLQTVTNFDMVDILPVKSGKLNAATYLAKKFGVPLSRCAALGDDDNDVEMLSSLGYAFVTAHTSDSIREACVSRPEHFKVATKVGVAAAEEMLDAILAKALDSAK